MTTMTEEKIAELVEQVSIVDLERGNYRLSDAIREGATVTDKATGAWGNGKQACAMHAAVIAAHARGYMK